jgi:hypothetical protein
MKEIKTIQFRRDRSGAFDDAVNAALREGWELKERFLAPGYANTSWDFHPIWVATLEREVTEDGN